ncbi:MAG: SUMF1/EgtB/PvdO family nonheme iron enzyme [Spirochaetaceae bacterium]
MRKRASESASAQSQAQHHTVKLTPLLGIPPTTYVPALLGAVLLVLLFFLLVFPGLRNNGTIIAFHSVPERASVLVDGARIGSTPVKAFVEKGRRSVTIRRPHFEEETFEVEVPGRLVGSLLFPRRLEITRRLTGGNAEQIAREAAQEFNRWSLVGEATSRNQFPPVLSAAATDLAAMTSSEETSVASAGTEELRKLLTHTLRDVSGEHQLADYLRAVAFARSDAGAPGGMAVAEVLRDILRYFDENPALAYLAASALPQEVAEEFRGSSWFDDTTAELVTEVLTATQEGGPSAPDPERIEVAGETFVEVPGDRFVMGPQGTEDTETVGSLERPRVVEVEAFFMMETEVTRRLYQRFVNDHPRWAPSSRDDLVDAGLVSKEYLNDWDDDSVSDQSTRPVRFVSYHAAEAFCEWLGDHLPEALTGYEVRLPTEAEWEWAAALNASEGYDAVFAEEAISTPLPVGSSEPGQLGIYDLLGNVWEWTSDWYHAGDYVVDAQPIFPGTQRVVRGGSWANERRSIGISTRGSQPPSWSTAFLGFRPVIAEVSP